MKYLLSAQELRQYTQEVAGRASVPFMKAAPSLVMPTEELVESCDEILRDRFGILPDREADCCGELTDGVMKSEDEPQPRTGRR